MTARSGAGLVRQENGFNFKTDRNIVENAINIYCVMKITDEDDK